MKKLFCSKCNSFKNAFVYANRFNSQKFCPDCLTALEEIGFDEEAGEKAADWIAEAIANAIMKM